MLHLVNITRRTFRATPPSGGAVVVHGSYVHTALPVRNRSEEEGAELTVRGHHCVSFRRLQDDGTLSWVESALVPDETYGVQRLAPGILVVDLPSTPSALKVVVTLPYRTSVSGYEEPAPVAVTPPPPEQVDEPDTAPAVEPADEPLIESAGESSVEVEEEVAEEPADSPDADSEVEIVARLGPCTTPPEPAAPMTREDLEALTMSDLRELASDLGLTIKSRVKEDFIVALLEKGI